MKVRTVGAALAAVGAGVAFALGSGRTSDRGMSGTPVPHPGQGAEIPGVPPLRAPRQIPLRGWKAVVMRTYGQLSADNVMLVAAGVTFYVLLALFPALTALVSIYGLLADPGRVVAQVEAMRGLLPPEVLDLLSGQMERIVAQPRGQLGFGFAAGLGVALWSANNGMKAIFEAMNIAYNTRESRSFLRLTATSLVFTLGAIFFVILLILAILVVPALIALLDPGNAGGAVFALARWPALFLIGIAVIMVIYRYGPDRPAPPWRWVLPGAAMATILWLCTSLGFSWYVSNFDSYNETYGSLGAVIAFMVWIWVSATIVILGAELNAEAEREGHRSVSSMPQS
ncbi:YihY/virulence factor BrkB family protein [Halodurantibacterium flavum]|uniref:YihY/virulence factor BrkB family protein n=1 Tax=Halodurantibacterium flavum TaxID=1382802 RepID=A0ABW4S8T3_9RHOB